MRYLTVGLLNIDQAELTINILQKLALLADEGWSVQLILVDNGSTEAQLQLLSPWLQKNSKKFSELLFVNAFQNLGATGGRNVILKLATADHLLFLDNDVILPDDPGWLNGLWQHMADDPHIGIIGPAIVFADYPDIVQVAGIGLTRRGQAGYLYRGDPVTRLPAAPQEVAILPSTCWLVRREAQQATGLFSDEYYPHAYEDIDFCVRLGLAGWKIICDYRIHLKHLEHVTSANLKEHPFARLMVRQAIRFREKWADILPEIGTLTPDDIYWGPIPKIEN